MRDIAAAMRAADDRRGDQLPLYVSTEKAQQILGDCSRRFLYDLLGEKRFRAVKVGGRLLIDTTSLLTYLGSLPQAQLDNRKARKGAS